MNTEAHRWPSLDFAAIRPTVDHLHRLGQIAGKYTLDQPFEPNWGNILMRITPRGFATPTLHTGDVSFVVEFEVLDDRVTVTASTGRAALPLEAGSVAGFYERFVSAVQPLGIPAPHALSQPEIADAPPLDEDRDERPYDAAAAHRVSAAQGLAAAALTAYQAPFRGYRPRVGLWWGGFDISATRYNGKPVTPPDTHPVFLQNGMTGEAVSVGFTLGDERSPVPAFYAYISPAPDGLEHADFGVAGASWLPQAGLVVLPWDAVRESDDPAGTVVRFGDAVYAAAVELGGWPDDLVGPRVDGWHAGRTPLFAPAP